MKNRKTTIAGCVALVAALLTVVSSWLTGGDVMAAIQASVVPAIAGLIGLSAADGGV